MPLVVSTLMGDASDVFDWILSFNPGNTQDLTTSPDVEGTLLWVPYLQGAEKHNQEPLPEASGGCHRLFNKGRYLCE